MESSLCFFGEKTGCSKKQMMPRKVKEQIIKRSQGNIFNTGTGTPSN